MAINAFQAGNQPSPIERLLGVVNAGLGIRDSFKKGQAYDDEAIKRKLETDALAKAAADATMKDDPTSKYSQGRQLGAAAGINFLMKNHYLSPEDASPLLKSVQEQAGSSLDKFQETSPLYSLAKAKMEADAKRDAQTGALHFRDDAQQERMDAANHRSVISRLTRDPQSTKRLNQYQNLDNALNNVLAADHLTPQQIDEFQQSIRANIGAGGGGVGERTHTYFNSMGLNGARWSQFLTGDPASIAKDSNMVTHLRQLATLEKQNIASQMDKRIAALSSGYGSMYKRRSDLKQDLVDAAAAQRDQYVDSGAGGAPAAAAGAGPGGLIPDANAKPPQLTSDDVAALDFAQKNPQDARSAKILQGLKSKGLIK